MINIRTATVAAASILAMAGAFVLMNQSPAFTATVSGQRAVATQTLTSSSATTVGFNNICPTGQPLPTSAQAVQFDPSTYSIDTEKVLYAEISPNGSNNAVAVDVPAHSGSVFVRVVAFCVEPD